MGGGSTIDATKAIGAAAFYDGDCWDLVTNKAPVTDCLPIVTVLTIAATSSEMECGGVDILSHIFDTDYFSTQDTMYMLDYFMEGLIKTVIKYAPVAIKEPDNYEARANLMWASSWALNGFIGAEKQQAPSCHMMEHELSAYYDITHGLGLAILTPRWMEYILDETTAPKFYQFRNLK